MKLTVLGCTAGSPLAGGACSGYLVSAGGTNLLFDCGPGVMSQLRKVQDPLAIDAVVISHMHRDHLLDIVPYASAVLIERNLIRKQDVTTDKPLLLIPPGGRKALDALSQVWFTVDHPDGTADDGDSPFQSKDFFDQAFRIEEYNPDEELTISDIELRWSPVRHRAPCFAVRATSAEGKTISFTGDTGLCEGLASFVADSDIFLCEATYLEDDPNRDTTHGHLTAREAGELAREANVKQLLVTHLLPDPAVRAPTLERAAAAFGGATALAEVGAIHYA